MSKSTFSLSYAASRSCSTPATSKRGRSVSVEITEVIAASSDDGFVRQEFMYGSPSSNAFTSTNDEMKVGYDIDGMGALEKYFWSFLRFTTIDIPQGSTISSAKIQMKYSGFESNSVGETVKISAEDIDDATAPATASDVVDATLTTANSTWTIPSMTTNVYYDSADITGVVQEIVNRSGWAANNDMNIILHDSSTGANWYARWWSHNKGAAHAPKLVVTYS